MRSPRRRPSGGAALRSRRFPHGSAFRSLWTDWVWPLWKLGVALLLLWVLSWILYLLLVGLFSG